MASDRATGVALQGDGKIVVVGAGGGDLTSDFALARYNPDGSLDTSFSGDGKQTTDFGRLDGANGVALQGDGKIVAVGDSGAAASQRLRARPLQPERVARHELLRRRQADDQLRGHRRANGVALQGERQDRRGRRAGGGRLRARPLQPERVARPELLRDGRQTTDFGGADRATGVALQGDGKIVAVGRGGAGDGFDA